MKLEIISRLPKGKSKPLNLVFVHGICVGAWVWETHFLPYFAAAGYAAHAVSLRGHAGSAGHEGLDSWSLADYAEDLQMAVETVGGPVVVIGHSMGGAVVQDWLRCGGKARGAALLASVPPWGLAPSAWQMGMTSPVLFQEFAKMASMGIHAVDQSILRRALFSDGVSDDVYAQFTAREQDESRVVSAEVQGARVFAPMPWQAPPMFVASGGDDKLIPVGEVRNTAAYYGVAPQLIEGMAHTVMIDPKWETMAGALLAWLETIASRSKN